MEAAQFVGVGKLVEAFQAEGFEEERRGFIEKRAPGLIGPAGDADDLALEQRGDDPIDGDAAHGFNLGPPQRLTVGNDSERFHRRLTEARRAWLGKESIGPDGKLGPGLELIAARDFLKHEGGAGGFHVRAQLVHGRLGVPERSLFEGAGIRRRRESGRLVENMGDGLEGQRAVGGKEERFNNAG